MWNLFYDEIHTSFFMQIFMQKFYITHIIGRKILFRFSFAYLLTPCSPPLKNSSIKNSRPANLCSALLRSCAKFALTYACKKFASVFFCARRAYLGDKIFSGELVKFFWHAFNFCSCFIFLLKNFPFLFIPLFDKRKFACYNKSVKKIFERWFKKCPEEKLFPMIIRVSLPKKC